MKALGISLVAAVTLCLGACGSDSSGTATPGAASGCQQRCAAVAANCGMNPADCTSMCAQVTETELKCMETTNCDTMAYDACVAAGGSAGADSAGGGGTSDRGVSGFDPGSSASTDPGASGSACKPECDSFDYCDESIGACVGCLESAHCEAAFNGPECVLKGTKEATCGCENDGHCNGHPSGPTCHSQRACSCSGEGDCAMSGSGSRCVDVIAGVGLRQCGCSDAMTDCGPGQSCLGNKCM